MGAGGTNRSAEPKYCGLYLDPGEIMGMGEKLVEWEYDDHPRARTVADYCLLLIDRLTENYPAMLDILKDVRPPHASMFAEVVPQGREYLAGNYRGAPYPQLIDRPVFIYGFDCAHYSEVHKLMDSFHHELVEGMEKIGVLARAGGWTPAQSLVALSAFVSHIFVNFLKIHPFANGNGHISRLLVWCIFQYKRIKCKFWQIPDRNVNPPDYMIGRYRNGDMNPLINCFLYLIRAENSNVALD